MREERDTVRNRQEPAARHDEGCRSVRHGVMPQWSLRKLEEATPSYVVISHLVYSPLS